MSFQSSTGIQITWVYTFQFQTEIIAYIDHSNSIGNVKNLSCLKAPENPSF